VHELKDPYSGGFLVLSVIVAIEESLTFSRAAFRSKEVACEALGLAYDKALFQGGLALNGAVMFVVLDYGRWHLVPALARPLLQDIGLVLGIVGAIWQTWADTWLRRHFAGDSTTRKLMTGGPFRYIRHPRYAGFLVKLDESRKLQWSANWPCGLQRFTAVNMKRKTCQTSLLGLATILTGFFFGSSQDPIARKQKYLAQGNQAFDYYVVRRDTSRAASRI
jgi:protein-S-isoprenylcysteine O-methyltransferase Ste14